MSRETRIRTYNLSELLAACDRALGLQTRGYTRSTEVNLSKNRDFGRVDETRRGKDRSEDVSAARARACDESRCELFRSRRNKWSICPPGAYNGPIYRGPLYTAHNSGQTGIARRCGVVTKIGSASASGPIDSDDRQRFVLETWPLRTENTARHKKGDRESAPETEIFLFNTQDIVRALFFLFWCF